MRCQILFSGNNKNNIVNVPSAELAERVVQVKGERNHVVKKYFTKKSLTDHKNWYKLDQNRSRNNKVIIV